METKQPHSNCVEKRGRFNRNNPVEQTLPLLTISAISTVKFTIAIDKFMNETDNLQRELNRISPDKKCWRLGVYAGWPIERLPGPYILWALENIDLDLATLLRLIGELKRRLS